MIRVSDKQLEVLDEIHAGILDLNKVHTNTMASLWRNNLITLELETNEKNQVTSLHLKVTEVGAMVRAIMPRPYKKALGEVAGYRQSHRAYCRKAS